MDWLLQHSPHQQDVSSTNVVQNPIQNSAREEPRQLHWLLQHSPHQQEAASANVVQNPIQNSAREEPRRLHNGEPSAEEKKQMFRSGQYRELIPYLKEEITQDTPSTSIRFWAMRAFDPESFAAYLEKQRQSNMRRHKFVETRTKLSREPSAEEKVKLFREGKWKLLVPYLSEPLPETMSREGVRLRVMKEFDPESYSNRIEKENEAKRKRKGQIRMRNQDEIFAKRMKPSADQISDLDDSFMDSEILFEEPANSQWPLTKDAEFVENLLSVRPKEKRISPERMREIFRKDGYQALVPYFLDEVRHLKTSPAIRNKIMQLVDPESWTKKREQMLVASKASSQRKQNTKYYPQGTEKEKVRALLSIEPEGPPPPLQEQLQMFQNGRFRELVPFYRDELKEYTSIPGLRFGIMQKIDPAAWQERNRKKTPQLKRINSLED